MSARTSILGLALLFAAAASAQEFKCPTTQGKKPLFNAEVFDGPPEKRGLLEPDDSRGNTSYTYPSWDVGYLFKIGRTPFMECRYGSLKDTETVTIKVDKPVQKCVFRANEGARPAEMICK
jgi:hypothetical protein